MATSQSIKEKCKQFVENQAKEVEAVQKENVSPVIDSPIHFVNLLMQYETYFAYCTGEMMLYVAV